MDRWKALIQQAAEGGGVGEAVHEEVEGGEADEGPAQHRYAGNNEDGAGECEDAEEGVGAEECGWDFGRAAVGIERGHEEAVEPAGEAPVRRNGASRQHQDEERDQPGGGLDPGHHEREAKGSGHDELVEAAFAAIGHGSTRSLQPFVQRVPAGVPERADRDSVDDRQCRGPLPNIERATDWLPNSRHGRPSFRVPEELQDAW